jgi:hypothetical protein
MLEFILDGVTVTEPEGLRELRHRIYYNDGLNGYLEQFDGSVSFYGSEYTTLRNRFFADGCAVVPVEVRNGGDSYLGNIFLNDAEWQPDKSKVTCEIVDRSFLSLIDNNKDIKAYLNVPRSKNDVDISTATVVQTNLSFGENEVGVGLNPTPANRSGVRVFDAFRFLVAFMSDGQIGFVSDYFNPETDPNDPTEPRNPTLITGQEVGTADGDEWPYLSFEELFTDINKLYNISFSMEVVNGIPTMRIEPKAYFRSIAQTLAVADASGVQQEAVRESYYQLMKFGDSEKVDEERFYPPATFAAWQREEYHLGGQCNTKAVLDLQLKTLIINTNAIQSQLPDLTQNIVSPPSEEYNEDIFLVIFDGNNQTVNSVDPLNAAGRYYNSRLRNFEVANRWGDGVPFPIFQFLGSNLNGARAFRDTDYIPPYVTINLLNVASAIVFPDTTFPNGFDPNGNMSFTGASLQVGTTPPNIPVFSNNGATIYTSPVAQFYSLSFRILTNSEVFGSVAIVIYDDVNPVQQFVYNFGNASFQNGIYTFEGSQLVFLPLNWRVAIVSRNTASILQGSFFQVGDLFEITKTYDPASNYLFKSSAQYPLPSDWWRQFRTQWHQRIQLTYGSGQAQGYVREISRNIYTGDADVEIVSKFADVTR